MVKSNSTLPTLSDEDMYSLESEDSSLDSDDCSSCYSSLSIGTAEMARFQKIFKEDIETNSVDLNGYQSFRRSSRIFDPSLDPFEMARFQKAIDETLLETDSVDLNKYQSLRRSSSLLYPSLDPFDIDVDDEDGDEFLIPLRNEPSVKIVIEFDIKCSLKGPETTKLVDSSKTQRGHISPQLRKRSMNSAAA